MLGLLLLTGCATVAARHDGGAALTTGFAGKVYLFRGGAGGVFSAGMDRWGRQLALIGVPNQVHSQLNWQACAEEAQRERGVPIILVGHSFGADAAVRMARKLDEADIPVALLLTMDPTTKSAVPKNVRRAVNLYMPNRFWQKTPIWHGVPLEAEAAATALENIHLPSHAELNLPGLTHSNLDDDAIIQQEGIRRILGACKKQLSDETMK
jgi:hypothetical protein